VEVPQVVRLHSVAFAPHNRQLGRRLVRLGVSTQQTCCPPCCLHNSAPRHPGLSLLSRQVLLRSLMRSRNFPNKFLQAVKDEVYIVLGRSVPNRGSPECILGFS
jgi:hypothetical protein